MRQFSVDAYGMMTRLIDADQPVVFLDVGANVGATTARMREVFPRARVYSFEPQEEPRRAFAERHEGDEEVVLVGAAVGERDGEIDLHLTGKSCCASVLRTTERGVQYGGAAMAPAGVRRVPVVSLDAWAREARVSRADMMKIDVQGAELGVLRGAEKLLESITAVNSEALIAPEYEGCCTFTDIDLFLRQRGFMLHQVHELWVKGPEEQTAWLDALWVKSTALEKLRGVVAGHGEPHARGAARRALHRLRAAGAGRIGVYGAG
ncbi:MAG: FkbM family methyltransferase, partial [Phycisphaerales bacterium]